MTNDEIRSNDEARMTNGRERGPGLVPSAFVIRISDFFRHSIFVIRFFSRQAFPASQAPLDDETGERGQKHR